MKLRRMKQHLRGAFTVDTPRKRLRMWVGIPVILVTNSVSSAFSYNKQKELIQNEHPVQAAALSSAPLMVVGAALTAIPYTRWAGILALGWSLLAFGAGSMVNRLPAVKETANIMGSPLVRVLRG